MLPTKPNPRTTVERPRAWWLLMRALTLVALLAPTPAAMADGACSDTAQAQFIACRNEVKDDYWSAVAVCLNEPDSTEREECLAEAAEDRAEARHECAEQRDARLDLCEDLGEDPYDPDFDPANFDSDFSNLTSPNLYYPLELAPGPVGNMWQYEGDGEEVAVQVLAKTKDIEGVTCIVVNDVVTEAAESLAAPGDVIEDTDDWIAQNVDGSVHYCGELAQDFEYFDGDNPREAELVEIDGSFKAGRDGAKSGILMPAVPQVGDVYRQEWAVGDAEDAAEVLSTTYIYGADTHLDELVPQELAEALCNDNPAGPCVVTGDFTPLEPDVYELKYYAAGVGLFLEVNLEEGEIVELVDCNFEPCMSLLP